MSWSCHVPKTMYIILPWLSAFVNFLAVYKTGVLTFVLVIDNQPISRPVLRISWPILLVNTMSSWQYSIGLSSQDQNLSLHMYCVLLCCHYWGRMQQIVKINWWHVEKLSLLYSLGWWGGHFSWLIRLWVSYLNGEHPSPLNICVY